MRRVRVLLVVVVVVVVVVAVRVVVIVGVRMVVIMIVPVIMGVIVIVVMLVALPHVAQSLRIRCTAMAAPKPLSMLTTTTPDAQLVSMENSAVKPFMAVP